MLHLAYLGCCYANLPSACHVSIWNAEMSLLPTKQLNRTARTSYNKHNYSFM